MDEITRKQAAIVLANPSAEIQTTVSRSERKFDFGCAAYPNLSRRHVFDAT
jgi:hypothetical protein